MSSKDYTAEYRRNRKVVLAGNPPCVWCGQPADTVDHVIERDAGGSDGLDNLRPACRKCNYKRGAQYGNAKRAALVKARTEAVSKAETARKRQAAPEHTDEPGTFLDRSLEHPGPAGISVSPTGPKRRRNAPKAVETAPEPHGTPRLETVRYGGSSYGPLVAEWCRRYLGVELMPWQIHVLTGQLEHDGPTDDSPGRLRRRLSTVSCARQNGKSVALRALVGWWLCEAPKLRGGPQTVITTAHALDLAVALFDDLAPVLEELAGAKPKWSYGRNQLRMPDGSVWLVRAATASAGHGRSPDLVVADELWDINDGVIDDGLIPAQRARPAPLFSGWSTAGTEASTWFLRTREAALRAIDTNERGSLYYAEYSPAPSADLTNPETWAAANPALGHTLQLETLIDESRGPNRSAFMRASLNLWVAAASAWLEPGTWDRCHVPGDLPAPVVLAVDLSTDGGRFSGVAAGFDSAGRVVPWVAFQCPTEHEAWEHIERMMAGPGVRLAVTPPLEIHTPPRLKPRTSTVGYGELVKWTALVERMISDGRVAHRGDVALSDHLARAVAVRTQNGLAISSQKSPGPVELARLFVFAAALCSIPADKSRPAMGRARTVPTVRR